MKCAEPGLFAALALLAVGALAGCQTARSGAWIGDTRPPATRSELYRLHGPPDAIRREEGSTWLRYDSSVVRGMTLGARFGPQRVGAGLVFSRSQSVADRVWVQVASDGRILRFEPMRAEVRPRYRLWPFGR